jgi:hypothetical protein
MSVRVPAAKPVRVSVPVSARVPVPALSSVRVSVAQQLWRGNHTRVTTAGAESGMLVLRKEEKRERERKGRSEQHDTR